MKQHRQIKQKCHHQCIEKWSIVNINRELLIRSDTWMHVNHRVIPRDPDPEDTGSMDGSIIVVGSVFLPSVTDIGKETTKNILIRGNWC